MTYQTAEKPEASKRCVYFIEAMTLGFIKIGSTRSLERRMKTMQTGSPDALNLIGLITPPCAWTLEAELHKRFWYLRQHGEWFRGAPELREFVEKHAAPVQDRERQALIDSAIAKCRNAEALRDQPRGLNVKADGRAILEALGVEIER